MTLSRGCCLLTGGGVGGGRNIPASGASQTARLRRGQTLVVFAAGEANIIGCEEKLKI